MPKVKRAGLLSKTKPGDSQRRRSANHCDLIHGNHVQGAFTQPAWVHLSPVASRGTSHAPLAGTAHGLARAKWLGLKFHFIYENELNNNTNRTFKILNPPNFGGFVKVSRL
jgi:hypothetical protein